MQKGPASPDESGTVRIGNCGSVDRCLQPRKGDDLLAVRSKRLKRESAAVRGATLDIDQFDVALPEGESAEVLFRHSDGLYAAKAGGRNTVVLVP